MKQLYPLSLFLVGLAFTAHSQNTQLRSDTCSVAITNPMQPVTIYCNDTVLLTSRGYSNYPIANYSWSNGENGLIKSAIPVYAAGNYTVTATDSIGCNAWASVTVFNPNVSDSVSFELPIQIGEKQYPGCLLFFINTSISFEPPWIAILDPLGNNSDDVNIADGSAHIPYTYETAGMYKVTLTMDSAGCLFNSTKSVTITNPPLGYCCCDGIPVVTNTTPLLQIFPNPSSDKLNIKVTGFIPQYLSVYDIDGRKLSHQKFVQQIDISGFPAGVYFIEVSGENNMVRNKVVKISAE